ncbi:hypothetical protein N7466_005697 [Penicillium verhagenii]|uniref:uncharacterized protein n=1 Tax=Penicillium verhagenii TaxID=1562060 RepID=UPI0025459077|nr:uncharacterized protein N7466_005697 [Penicillium verhagenii]KAJ5930204.1 hypothetical protein N7466_005697 [Penicillium verhagenii]
MLLLFMLWRQLDSPSLEVLALSNVEIFFLVIVAMLDTFIESLIAFIGSGLLLVFIQLAITGTIGTDKLFEILESRFHHAGRTQALSVCVSISKVYRGVFNDSSERELKYLKQKEFRENEERGMRDREMDLIRQIGLLHRKQDLVAEDKWLLEDMEVERREIPIKRRENAQKLREMEVDAPHGPWIREHERKLEDGPKAKTS